ncbi:hypothetical protein [Paenibacillus jiagnxiensis]|uniref:hypothetical protein n=1 Tax=Paenibacillus jiagnxiensis TaxID=3228926 RepID=UPI0033AD7A06
MAKTQQIKGFENQFVNYSGLTIDDQYAIFYVISTEDEETMAALNIQDGILKYDFVNQTSQFFAYEQRVNYYESRTFANDDVVYYVFLEWENRDATFKIYQLDCHGMQSELVFKLTLQDSVAKSPDVSALRRTEFYGINRRYLIVGVPELDPFSKKQNSGFSHYLLIDIEGKKSYPIPEAIGNHDRIVHLSYIDVFEHEGREYLMIDTGRIGVSEKHELWERYGFEMIEGVKMQSVVVIPLDTFVSKVKNKQPIDQSYILSQCNQSSGLAHSSVRGSIIYVYKHHFLNNSSELLEYNLSTGQAQNHAYQETYDRLFTSDRYLYGVKRSNRNELIDLKSGEKLFSCDPTTEIRWANETYIIVHEYQPEQGAMQLRLYNFQTKKLNNAVTGQYPSFNFIPSADLIIFSG